MKAGTAQRVTLNLLSTLIMIRLGRVHEGLMVDVRAINAKLVERSENIAAPIEPARATGKPVTRSRAPAETSRSRCCCWRVHALLKLTSFLSRPEERCELRCDLLESGRRRSSTLTIAADIPSTVRDNASEKWGRWPAAWM